MNERKTKPPVNAVVLRYLALACMLLDHLWATVVPGNLWMTVVGRLAFPIFAFQIVEGYTHTSNFKGYAKRLLLFGLVSEIPFNLVMGGSWINPFQQNVMFTLLFGLMALRSMDKVLQTRDFEKQLAHIGAVAGWVILGTVTFVDYGGYGVLTVLLFGLTRCVPGIWGKGAQLAGMVAIHWFAMKGQNLLLGGFEVPVQAFAILALIPIWLYNGQKGPRSKALQLGSYLFYPAHLLLLWAITQFI